MRLSSIAAALVALVVVFLNAQPVMAAALFFSELGTGSTCSQSAPCSFATAVSLGASSEIACADSSTNPTGSSGLTIAVSITINCAGTAGSIGSLIVDMGAVVTLRNFTMWQVGINLKNGTVILDNVHVTFSAVAISGQPTSPSTLVVKNSTFDSNGSGVLLKPSAGGSLSARFDHVTIAGNSGGGIKIDTTNGPVTVDVTDSEVSSNSGNGLNAIGGAGGPAILSISRSVIAKNGVAGVQVNGAMAAAMIDTTLLDGNMSGATSVVGGGHILTYGNNRIVGSSGSGFTGPASLQ